MNEYRHMIESAIMESFGPSSVQTFDFDKVDNDTAFAVIKCHNAGDVIVVLKNTSSYHALINAVMSKCFGFIEKASCANHLDVKFLKNSLIIDASQIYFPSESSRDTSHILCQNITDFISQTLKLPDEKDVREFFYDFYYQKLSASDMFNKRYCSLTIVDRSENERQLFFRNFRSCALMLQFLLEYVPSLDYTISKVENEIIDEECVLISIVE